VDTSNATYAIIICNRCRDPVLGARAAQSLIERLRSKLPAERCAFETIGCMAGCDRPLAVGFRAPAKAAYLFGDINPVADADALAEFAKLYAMLPDGWSKEGERPAGLKGKTLARIPAAAAIAP